MNEVAPLDRQVLVERHLVSHELGDGARPRGILIAPDARLSLMINEEDHLRLQALTPGLPARRGLGAGGRRGRRAGPGARVRLQRGDRLPDLVPDQRGHRPAGLGADPPAGAGAARGDPAGAEEHHAGRTQRARALRRAQRGHGQPVPDLEPDHAGSQRAGLHREPGARDAPDHRHGGSAPASA